MNLVPKRGFGEISIKSGEDPVKANERISSASQPMVKGNGHSLETVGSAAVIDMPNSEDNCGLGAMSQANPVSHDAKDASELATPGGKAMQRRKGTGGKSSGKELSLKLVHGDAAILEGDDFEVSIMEWDLKQLLMST